MGPINQLNTEHKNWREINLKKRKRKAERIIKKLEKIEEGATNEKSEQNEVMPEEVPRELRTCSIAVPGSILMNTQSPALFDYVVGQIARAACIYKINEIIVFDDICDDIPSVIENGSISESKRCCYKFAKLLQYLECPQYLRKSFFPLHNDLKYAGLMNPLDAPHHLRQDEDFNFREGVTTNKRVKDGKGTYVEVGLLKQVYIDKSLQPGLRVTVKIIKSNPESKKLKGSAVSPDSPQKELNIYWGYSVRIANSVSEVFSKCPYAGGYDISIGTSDKGRSIDDVKKRELKDFKHCLIVFGGLKGLESAVENDNTLDVTDASLLFDHYLNTCPEQGSRTIRTEEAIFITLAELRKKMLKKR